MIKIFTIITVTLGFLIGGLNLAFADTLIKGARIMDGTGAPAYLGDVRIKDGKIIKIGDLDARKGEEVIEANGLILSPGFIDTHSHHDWGLMANRDGIPILTQGITTSLFGQDGGSSLPLKDNLDDFDQNPAAVNMASYVGHNTLRMEVMGEDNKREATTDEISAMVKLLATEMKSGALGLSTGIEYEPGIYSSHEEVLTLAKEAARLGGRYISHMRSEDRYFWDSIEEIINIGRVTGMPVQISHIKLAAKAIWGQTDKLLRRLNEARADGIKITADIYPYEYWQSTLWVLLPERDADDLVEIKNVLDNITPADGIIFMKYEPNPSYVGKSMTEIAKLRGLSEVETFSELLKESKAWAIEHETSAQSIMGKSMLNSDIAELMKWEFTNICSDGGYEGHPRGYGAFPRFLSHFVKGMGIMSMEEGIRHMTSLPAFNMGFKDRGEIKVGYAADLVLFNAETIKDNADLADRQAISTGIEKVWVNGVLVLDDGKGTGARPGQVLRRD